MVLLTDTEAAYLAGVFDGEGTLGYYFKKSGKYHVASLAIYNTDPRVMAWIRTHVSVGGVYLNKNNKHKGWQWQLNSKKQIIAFLNQIRPYLVIKAEQVDLLLSLWDAEQKIHRGRRLSEEVLYLRQDTEMKLKQLKTAYLESIH